MVAVDHFLLLLCMPALVGAQELAPVVDPDLVLERILQQGQVDRFRGLKGEEGRNELGACPIAARRPIWRRQRPTERAA
jgi:hypothetical protein